MKRGDLVTLHNKWNTYPTSLNPWMDSNADTLHRGEVSIVMCVKGEYVQVLSPRSIAGWIWVPQLVVA